MKKTVVVTGVGGGIGRAIATRLHDCGMTVIGVDRVSVETTVPYEVHECDLKRDPLDFLGQCDAVVHTAAMLDLSLEYDELAPDNVDALDRLLEHAAHVDHFVHLSDGAIYESGRGLRTESDPHAHRNHYELTKSQAEGLVEDSQISWTILRPAIVYGPGTESMSAGLVTLPPILRNFFRYVPGLSGGNRANWAHVDDVASAVECVLFNSDAHGEAYNVADDTPLGFGEAITAIAEAYGFALGPLFPFPSPTILSMFTPVVDRGYVESSLRAVLTGQWDRIVEKQELTTPLRPKVDRSVVFFVSEDNVLDNSKLKELGWDPKWTSFVDGIPETILWYQERNWVPTYSEREERERVGYGFSFTHEFNGFLNDDAVKLVVRTELPNVSRADLAGDANFAVSIDGLVEAGAGEGTADFAFVTGRTLTYQFGFSAADGSACRAEISTKLFPLRPISSLAKWRGSLVNDRGEEMGPLEVEIDFAGQAVAMLMSFSLLS